MTREEFKKLVAERRAKSRYLDTHLIEVTAMWAFDTLALPVFNQFYGSDEIPIEETLDGHGQGYSIDVLIDLDGTQKFYSVGWYNFEDKRWRIQSEDRYRFKLDAMTWTYIKRNDLTK